MLCGGGYGRLGLLQRSTPTRADDQQACFCTACVTCNFELDNISVSIQRYWDHPVLHPNHYLVVELCHSLVFAYAVLRLVDFCSTSKLFSSRRTLSSVFRPNLSRPEQERVIQISSHILSVRTKNYWTCVCTKHQVFLLPPSTNHLHQTPIICTKHQVFALASAPGAGQGGLWLHSVARNNAFSKISICFSLSRCFLFWKFLDSFRTFLDENF